MYFMKSMKKIIFSVVGILAIFVLALFTAQTNLSVAQANDRSNDKIPGQYIVVLKDNVTDSDAVTEDLVRGNGLGLLHKYGSAIKGFAATIPEARLQAISRDPRVQFISKDYLVSTTGKPGDVVTQAIQIPPTGVKRIDALAKTNKGAGIGVAVIDTGIDLTHPDLSANIAPQSKTCIARTKSANDDNGHGTHVAGTIAALNNTIGVVGVAPEAKLYAVKVLDRNGSGSWSSVICGIDWVTANASFLGIKVANMSLGGSGSSDNNCGKTNNSALHKAICNSVAKGVTYVVAAGNSAVNASLSVPAAYDDAVITVSALVDTNGASGGGGAPTSYGADDTFASFSNYGSVVDLGAPGVSIFSTWKGGSYNTISGTSMASPHVSGAAALYIASNPSNAYGSAILKDKWKVVRDALRLAGEALDSGHTDPSSKYPEPVVIAGSL